VLALVPFSLTLIPGLDYGAAFVLAMAVLVLASFLIVWLAVPGPRAAAFTVYMLLAGMWTLFGRYDLVVSLVVLGAVVAARRERWTLAYALLACGVLLKLYPLFLAPIFVIEQRRRHATTGRVAVGAGTFAGVVGLGLLTAAVLAPRTWLSPFTYALQRPVQAESVPSTILWVLSGFGSPGKLEHSFSSANVISDAAPVVVALSGVALVVGLLVVYARVARGRLSLPMACIAAILVVLCTNKVLSPQYLVWLLPLVGLELGLTPLWIGICILTFIEYPVLYEVAGLADNMPASSFESGFLLTVAARNALLVIAAVQAIRGSAPARALITA
jgi:hypothetical protein